MKHGAVRVTNDLLGEFVAIHALVLNYFTML